MRYFLVLFLAILLGFSSPVYVLAKTDLEKEIARREKMEKKALKKRAKLLKKLEKAKDEKEKAALEEDLTELEEFNSNHEKQEPEQEEKRSWFGFGNEKTEQDTNEAEVEGIKLEKLEEEKLTVEHEEEKPEEEKSEIEELRAEIKANEEKALNFIFQSEELESDIESAEKFFSKTEKQQLLELWRSTLARNRTIQFVIKSLSTDPDNYEKNNAVMQVLSRALFVPFYAVSAVADNALIQGGTSVGARVIGDVMDAKMQKQDKTRQVTRTDLIVLFMLVDEVAERLRNSYYSYKESKIEKQLLDYEIKLARLDLDKAMELNTNNQNQSAVFFTKTVIRDVERKLRQNKLNFKNSHRKLIELAGEEAVNNVDLLIDLEIDESLGEILGV